ncbi:sulfatase [bacterium]|nr:sulfatase [candidate division CSSED10-310 bacterium]
MKASDRLFQVIKALSILSLWLAACDEAPTPVLPETSTDLLKNPAGIVFHEKIVTIDLQNSLDQRIFRNGWLVESGRISSNSDTPTLEFRFDRIRDRIIKLSVDGAHTSEIEILKGGDVLLALPVERTTQQTLYQWVMQGKLQTTGLNTLRMKLPQGHRINVAGLAIQEGAARIGYAAVNQDIRHSLIMIPDVSVAFPVSLPHALNRIEMSIGIDDLGREASSDGVTFQVIIRSDGLAEQLAQFRLETASGWVKKAIPIENRFAGKRSEIVLESVSDTNEKPEGDIIAVADFCLCGRDDPPVEWSDRPSIILITMDSCRIDRLGFGGDHLIRSPALDRMAASGFVFSDCICQINNTPPSHFTILTSKRPRSHGVYDMVTPLSPAHPTVARLLEPSGYHSAAATSAAWLSALTHGLGPGFERFFAPREAQRRGPETLAAARTWLASAAGNASRQPFFFWLHLFDPHTPLDPPPPYDRMYYSGNPRDPANPSMDKVGFSPEQVEYMRNWIGDITDINYLLAQYRSEITYMDRVIEEIRVILSDSGADRTTWVVLTADHGLSLDEHDLYFIMAGMYEQQMHIPLIIVPPTGIPARKVYPETVQSLDIAPTIMDIAHLSIPDDFEGRSLLPLVQGHSIPIITRVISEHANNQAVMIRDSKYKYIRYLDGVYYREPQIGIYDLKKDPMELSNMHGKLKPIESNYSSRTDQFLAQPVGRADTGAADSEVLQKKLRALGYISQ